MLNFLVLTRKILTLYLEKGKVRDMIPPMNPQLYPLSSQPFEDIRKRGLTYVDKTDLVYRMTHEGTDYVFLSCPRCFGKTLLVSIPYSYFEGRKERFITSRIDTCERHNGLTETQGDSNIRLTNLIERLYEKTGLKVVAQIDEYDTQLLDIMYEEEKLPKRRNILRNFDSETRNISEWLVEE